MDKMAFSKSIMNMLALSNNFHDAGRLKVCKPLLVEDKRIGVLLPNVIDELRKHPDVFEIQSSKDGNVISVQLHKDLKTYDARSEAVGKVVNEWRKNDAFCALRGWRNECFNAWSDFSEPPLLKMERTATAIFGIQQYGCHTNGYLTTKDRGLCVWVARRSATKSTWPGKLDQMAAGGLSDVDDVLGCAKRECQEEASVPDELLEKLQPVGCMSYFYEDKRGVFPDCQFIFDLEVPESFTPVNADGEVDSFTLMDIDQIKNAIAADEFKFNCGLIMVDFFIRHGIITPDGEPNYGRIIEGMHTPLL